MTDRITTDSEIPASLPPRATTGPLVWVRRNLFATPGNIALTVLGLALLIVVVPPLTSQYLNIVKNSSLAVAIGYPDLVNVFTGTVLNQTGKAIECVTITMLTYGAISLLISLVMNWYNRRVMLVER